MIKSLSERHLEKTPIGYIQWRFQDGHDRKLSVQFIFLNLNFVVGELVEKATRVLTPEEKALLEKEWAGRDGSKRKLEVLLSLSSFVLDDDGS